MHEIEIPATMRAAVIDATGGPEVFRLASVPTASPISDELLVHVAAAGINPIDAKTRAGRGTASAIRRFPAILGHDFSGIVAAVPYAAHPFSPGDEVYGMVPVPRIDGTFAQFVTVPSLSIAPKPRNLSFAEAAGVPLAAMTAWGALDVAAVSPGQRVLVHAGAGGVGHFAVQFARLRGAEVITTASAHNAEWLLELGATRVIDYRSTRFEDEVTGVDVVIDLMGNVSDETGRRSLTVMKPGGTIVNLPTGSWPEFSEEAAAAGMRATGYRVAPSGATLREITRLIEENTVRVHVDRVYPLDEIAAAHRSLEEGHTRGKIVIDLSAGSAS